MCISDRGRWRWKPVAAWGGKKGFDTDVFSCFINLTRSRRGMRRMAWESVPADVMLGWDAFLHICSPPGQRCNENNLKIISPLGSPDHIALPFSPHLLLLVFAEGGSYILGRVQTSVSHLLRPTLVTCYIQRTSLGFLNFLKNCPSWYCIFDPSI